MKEEIKEVKETKSVAEIIIDQLAELGIEYIFGIPGETNLALIDALRKSKKIKFILVRHEESAALMASGYAKATGKIGVCLSIAGPGATNLITGLYDAKMDRVPVLALTGQVSLQFIGSGIFQEIDQNALFEPICVFNKIIDEPQRATELILLACKHALLERGVAHLGIPLDIQRIEIKEQIKNMNGRFPNVYCSIPKECLNKAIKLINEAKKPMLIVGWGSKASSDYSLRLAEKVKMPIATTLRAKGIVPENHPLVLGGLGDTGTDCAREIINKADLLVVIGTSFSEKTGVISTKKIIQIDTDPLIIGKLFPVELGIVGSAETILPHLFKEVKAVKNREFLEEAKISKINWIKKIKLESKRKSIHNIIPIRVERLIAELEHIIDDDAIITVDVGDNCYWFGRNFSTKKQTVLISGYLGTMGFGLPSAIAAKLAFPKKQVVCITGDGGFSMVMADFITAVVNNVNIKVIIFDNSELAMIGFEQDIRDYPRFGIKLKNPNFAEYAKLCGGKGIRIKDSNKIKDGLKTAFKNNQPTIVDVIVEAKR